ncbi:MAG: phage holin family protein [Abditibacteriota bacterium]|nr:phage holin family protein [Abditibacteriota bacterium]
MKILLRWACGFAAVLLTMKILTLFGGTMTWENIWQPIIFVPVLSAANALLRPVVRLLSAPITCLTLGLFSLVINALFFELAAWLTGIKIGFWPAMGGSIIYTILANILSKLFVKEDEDK